MAKLVCQAGPDAGHEYPLNKEKVVFGRRSGCEVQIMDSMASREHFIVRQDGKLFTCIDLESRNGTRVNGRKVTERQLEFGDRIRVGEVEYIFVKEDGDVELRDLLTSKYEVIEKIGEGGMGVVYKAKQRSMDRTVALKILASKYSSRPKFVERFIEEARAAGRLNHPNIIQVHDVDTENGIHYFSMEFIEGGTCMQLLRSRGPLPPGEALEVIRLTAKALQYAHENRLIHRDVKPDNIMVGANNMVKLADLGISKTFDEAEAEGRPKKVVGTPHYMAPEAAMGKKIDHRVDIYSLGTTLYHMLAGTTPYHGKSATSVLKAHIKEAPEPLAEARPELPAALCSLVDKMMAKKAEERYQSMTEVIEAISGLQNIDGLQPDLPSGGETLLLRRFASGDQPGTGTGSGGSGKEAAVSKSGDDHTTGGSDTATRRNPSATRSRPGQAPAALRYVLILVVVVLGAPLAVQAIKMINQQLGQAQQGDTTDTNQPAGPSAAELAAQRQRAQQDELNERRTRQAAQARRIRDRLDSAPDEAGLRDIQGQLEQLSSDAVDELREELETLQGRLNQQLDAQLELTEQEAFRRVSAEIGELRANKDYDAALRRLSAFKVRRSDDLQRKVTELERSMRTERDNYMETLDRRVKQLTTMKDADGLRRLRDEELPQALLGGQIAKNINAALQKLDRAHNEALNAIVTDARTALTAWDWTTFDQLVAEKREVMGTSKPGKDLDALVTLSDQMRRFMETLDEVIQNSERKPRYRQLLNGIRDADIVRAEPDALILRPPSGGEARVPMEKVSEAELRTVTTIILGEEAVVEHDALLKQIAATK
ncbi:MAG: protein kinase [Planctomycetota bacterium]|jgi:serine/threonine protein kinase|nr:protein kinase [Planctomycetota bacterium]